MESLLLNKNILVGYILDVEQYNKSEPIFFIKTLTKKIYLKVENYYSEILLENTNYNLICILDSFVNNLDKNEKKCIKIEFEDKFDQNHNLVNYIKILISNKKKYNDVKNFLISLDIQLYNCDIYDQNSTKHDILYKSRIDPTIFVEINNYYFSNGYFYIKDFSDIKNVTEEIHNELFNYINISKLYFDIETTSEISNNFPNADNKKDIITTISFSIERETYKNENTFCKNYLYYISEKSLHDNNFLKDNEIDIIKNFNTEQDLLEAFIENLMNAEIICGFNQNNFDLPYIIKRCELHKINLMQYFPVLFKLNYINNNVLQSINGIANYDLYKGIIARDGPKLLNNSLQYVSMKYLCFKIKKIDNNKILIENNKTKFSKSMEIIASMIVFEDTVQQYKESYQIINVENINDFETLLTLDKNIKLDVKMISIVKNEMDHTTLHKVSNDYIFNNITSEYNINIYKKSLVYCMNDTRITKEIVNKNKNLLSLIEKGHVRKTILQDTLNKGNSFLNQYILINRIRDKNYVIKIKKFKQDYVEEKYKGATVVDLTSGIYDLVIVVDFASLYPSLIISHNICSTTLYKNIGSENPENYHEIVEEDNGKIYFIKQHIKKGILPTLCEEFIKKRKDVNEKLKNTTDYFEKLMLDVKQSNIKIANNSIYGSCGDKTSVLYDKNLAASVTCLGRKYLDFIDRQISEIKDAKVVAGDSDSIFIHFTNEKLTNYEKYILVINKLNDINKQLISPMKLEFEKIYNPVLLICKKKRIGIKKTFKIENENLIFTNEIFESKGSSTIRRDIPIFIKNLENDLTNLILKTKDYKNIYNIIYNHIDIFIKSLESLDINNFIITKTLKNKNDYSTNNKSIHYNLALKLIEMNYLKEFSMGTKINYVYIHELRSNYYQYERILPIDLMMKNNYKLDYKYYREMIYKLLENNFESVLDSITLNKLFFILNH
jgi:DNA polymerase elongation subunit (family B)